MANDDETIDVTVDLHDKVSRPAREAAEAVDDLGDEAKKAERRLDALQREADKAGRSLELLALKARAADMEFETTGERVSWVADQYRTKATPQVNKNTAAVNKQTKSVKKNSDGWRGFMKILGRFVNVAKGVPGQLFAIGKGLLAILAVAGAAAALQNIFGMIQALMTLGSLVAFLPTAISSLASTMIVLKVATSGVSDAIGAALSGDVDKLNAAMKNLSPSAQDFVMDIEDMSGAFKNLKRSVQEYFFKPFAVFTKGLIQETIVPITHGMRNVASALGYVVAQFMLFFKSFEGKTAIVMFFQSAVDAINAILPAIQPVLKGITAVMVVVVPFWKELTKFIGEAAVKFGEWLQTISASGQLEDWLNTAVGLLKQLGGIITNVFGIFKGVMDVLSDGSGFGPFINFLAAVNDWVNSDAGQQALLSFFQSLTSLIPVLLPILQIVAETIGNVLAPAILGIVQGLAPGFITFLQALAAGLAVIAPYFPPLATALGQLLAALAPLLQPLAQLIQLAAQNLTVALQVLAPIIAQVAQGMATLWAPAINAVMGLVQAFLPYLPQFTALFVQFGQQVAPILTEVANIFSQYLNQYLEEFATEILPEVMPQLMQLATLFSQYLLEALQELMPYIPQLAQFMLALMERSASLWPIIFQLAIVFLQVAKAAIPIGGAVLSVIGFFIRLSTTVVNVQTKILKFVGGVLSAIRNLPGQIGSFLSSIPDKFFNIFKQALDKVKGVIEDIKNTVKNANIGDLVSGAFNAINPFRFAGGPVDSGQPYTVGEIGKELFVPKVGTPQIVGDQGMETRKFTQPGMILPNYMLKAMEGNAALMRKHAANQERAAMPGLGRKESHTHYHKHEGDQLSATFTGNMTADVDIERAMNKFHRNLKRDDAERR